VTELKGPIVAFADLPSIEAYFEKNEHEQSGFWLKLAKAGAPVATISKAEAIEAALCHGWIDGQLAKFDEHYFLVRMTPRRSTSRWSHKNRETVERLMTEGRMRPSGRSEVEKAKADGRWRDAYQSQAKADPPADLLAAIAKNAQAKKAFAAGSRQPLRNHISRQRRQACGDATKANSRFCGNARARRDRSSGQIQRPQAHRRSGQSINMRIAIVPSLPLDRPRRL